MRHGKRGIRRRANKEQERLENAGVVMEEILNVPEGRALEASTDASLRAEILSYSRSRGLFAGASVAGTSLRPDDDATMQVYGRSLTARRIITGKRIAVPPSGRRLVDVLQTHAPRNESKRTETR